MDEASDARRLPNGTRRWLSGRFLFSLHQLVRLRARRRGGGTGPAPLGQERQQQRIGPRLDELDAAFDAKRLTMQTTTVHFRKTNSGNPHISNML